MAGFFYAENTGCLMDFRLSALSEFGATKDIYSAAHFLCPNEANMGNHQYHQAYQR